MLLLSRKAHEVHQPYVVHAALRRKTYRKNEVIEENKALLKTKYKAAKALGQQVSCLLASWPYTIWWMTARCPPEGFSRSAARRETGHRQLLVSATRRARLGPFKGLIHSASPVGGTGTGCAAGSADVAGGLDDQISECTCHLVLKSVS